MGELVRIRRHPKGYDCEIASLGGLPSALRAEDYDFRTAYAFLLRTEDAYYEGDTLVDVVAGIVHRYLQRGSSAPPTPKLEEAVCRHVGLDSVLQRQPDDGPQCGYRPFENEPPNPRQLRAALARACDGVQPVLDPSLCHDGQATDPRGTARLDSEEEGNFLDWASKSSNGNYTKYLLPQVEFADLGGQRSDLRRVDFLYCDGASEPFVIEIDGAQHEQDEAVDEARDLALESLGLEVKRLPASALKSGKASDGEPALRDFDVWWQSRRNIASDVMDERWVAATSLIQDATAVQFALTRLWARGTFQQCTSIAITGDLPENIVQVAFAEWKALVNAVIGAHGLGGELQGPVGVELQERTGDPATFRLLVESGLPWWHEVSEEALPDLVVRRCATPNPVLVATNTDPDWLEHKRSARGTEAEVRGQSLRWILQAAFRKTAFREGQQEAIVRCLDGKDTIVLLATGAGKSLIFHLSALLCPGTALVVAPLVALIEDQKDGLVSAGIRRIEGLHGKQSDEVERRAQKRLDDGTLLVLMMAPERLQKPMWRAPIQSAAEAGAISLAVVDEAHCVSEWGHDFRPVYLQLGRLLRDVFKIRTLLALTGTASRAVYNDMVAHLEVERNDPLACIRPTTHDRPEIEMQLSYCTSKGDAESARSGAFRSLRRKFRGNPDTVFEPRGSRSCCGIVFMPTVNNPSSGIESGVRLAQAAGLRSIEKYAGQEPYLKDRRKSAHQFKRNRATVMVATSGYGMGVDKPNVRWVIHPHLVSSLEAYYQQIGRAGRDGDQAYAIAVLHDEQPNHTDSVLDPDKAFDQARREYGRANRWDDVGTALHFHFRQFMGPDAEMKSLLETLESLNVDQPAGERRISLIRGGEFQQRDIGRLIRLGVVEYYQVDYGSKRITAHVREWSPQAMAESLREYIGRSDRARGEAVSEELKEELAQVDDPGEALTAGCRALVAYLYETVEPARRRALRETVLMARQCNGDQEIRRWMLDYLSEGKGWEKIEELLRRRNIDWDEWHGVFGDVGSDGAMEASRVRGLFIRALESNPGHPALLLGRAISEAASLGGVLGVVEENLLAALGALSRYARRGELDDAFDGICRWLERADKDGMGPLCGIARLSTSGHDGEGLEKRLHEHTNRWKDRAEVDRVACIELMDSVAADMGRLSNGLADVHRRLVGSG